MSARSAGTAALLCTLGLAVPAFAQVQDRPVVADAAGCPDRWQAAWREVMRVELGPRLIDGPSPPGEEIDQVTVGCEGQRAIITARPARGEAPVVHELSLSGIPEDAGPRLVALVAIELVTTRPRRLPPPAATPPPVAAAAPPPIAATAPASSRVLVGGIARVFLAEGGLQIWGGALRWQPPVRAGWGAVFDIDVGASTRDVAQGRVSGLLASIGGALEVRRATAHGSLEAGVGGRLGFARLAGEPLEPTAGAGRAVLRPWAGPFAFAALVVRRRRLCGALAVEVGYAAVGARGLVEDAVVSAVTGPWLGLSLSGGLQR